jgi:putative spermidine/putrescine transport system permease protein
MAALTAAPVVPGAPAPAAAPRGSSRAESRSGTMTRWLVLLLILGWLLLPLVAMLEFATRGPQGTRTIDPFLAIASNSNQGLLDSIIVSLEIAALTVLGMIALLVPTMTWAQLRVPRMRRVIEFICLLPLAIPAVVLVVGIAPIYRVINIAIGGTALALAFVDIILVLPYAYRAIDGGMKSIDVNTLADAARSLGASWPRVIVQIIVPNIRTGILSASVIAVALVLGEYTISSLLSYHTLQVVIYLLGKRDASIAVAVAFAALVFVFLLLILITRFAPGASMFARQEDRTE